MVDVFASTDYLLDAEQQWESLGIPSDKLTSLSDWSTSVVDQEKLEVASPSQVNNAFRPLLKLQKPMTKRTFSTNAILYVFILRYHYQILIALSLRLAILSIVIGYIVKGTVGTGIMPIRPWGLSRGQGVHTNKSLTTTAAASISTLLPNSIAIPPSEKDMQMLIVESATPISVVTTATRQAVTSTPPASTSAVAHTFPTVDNAPTECACGCGMITWSGKMLSTDLIIRPAASASALSVDSAKAKGLPSVTPSVTRTGFTRKGKGKATSFEVSDASLYALSTRIAGTIAEYFEFDFKSLLGVTDKNMQEVLDALQALYDAIARQTTLALQQSITNIQTIKKQVQKEMKSRNERAKAKAKQLKEFGRQYFSTVRDRIRIRTDLAKEHAKLIKERLKSPEFKEWREKRSEARQLRRLRRWEKKHFKRALKVH